VTTPVDLPRRPSIASVIARRWGLFLLLACIAILGFIAPPREPWYPNLGLASGAAFVLLLGAELAIYLAADYELKDGFLRIREGVLRRVTVTIPLANIQHLVVSRSLRERLLGLGTIGVYTSGSAGVEAVLRMLPEAESISALLGAAARDARESR
jgi:membrane protein YdbS with pleckstrin-like domain